MKELIENKIQKLLESGFRFGNYKDVSNYESFEIINHNLIKVIFWDFDTKQDGRCKFSQFIDINILPELRLLKLKKI